MRAVLETFGIETVLMTSGSKGYHLRAMLEPTTPIDDVALVARGTAALGAAANDGLLTLAFRKADRGDRVFVDWMRNTPRSTSVVPWSLRPKSGAPVATPISWQELGEIEPDGIGLRNVRDRSRKRPWSKLQPIDLGPAVENVRDVARRCSHRAGALRPIPVLSCAPGRSRRCLCGSLRDESSIQEDRVARRDASPARPRRNCAGDLIPERKADHRTGWGWGGRPSTPST